jgi:2-isopropylmalate synthase
VAKAKRYTPNVEFSAMDATRSDVEFLLAAIEAAIREGATTMNIPDTVGYAIPLSLEASFVLSDKESME